MARIAHARRALIALSATIVVLLVPSAATAQGLVPPTAGLPEPASPDLIDRAQEAGRIDNERANLYRVYALKGDSRLPQAYESDTPFDGTLELLQARRELRTMEPGPERRAVAAQLRAPPDPNPTFCDVLSPSPLPNSTETAHFYIQYNATTLDPTLTIEDYRQSLETAWLTEINSFDWADPPVSPAAADPATGIDSKYHVRIEALAPVLYGFVSSRGTYAGPVGDNPNTTWPDRDADASCMGLNQNYTLFPGTPRQALDATTAHEFNHSLQFGYGALNGSNVPDDNFIEGGATWMEDEVFDGADDNYNYLYPKFDDSMGEYDEGDIYAYWLTWRGLTERFGTGTAGGGEQVMQDFWELTSKNSADTLTAMQQALVSKGTTLPGAYHDYAIAAKFMATCAGGYALPYCFEEAAGYTSTPPARPRGKPQPHGGVSGVGQFFKGQVEDNYALNWVVLPPNAGTYDVSLSNDSAGGTFRGTVACDTGTTIRRSALPSPVGGGEAQTTSFDSNGCQQVVAVITNETQTAPNPDSSEPRDYTVSTTTPAETTRPETTITSGPTNTTRSSAATFTFASNESGSSFECRYDGGVFAPCSSPNSRTGLADGQHRFDVRATDTAGNTDLSPASRTFTVDTRPVPLPVDPAPALTNLRLSSRRFRATRSGRAITPSKRGMRVRYSLSEAATVAVRYERKTTGRRVGGRCRATTRANSRRAKCVRWIPVRGTARHPGKAGVNVFRLTGRMSGRALRPAVYRLRLSARDGAGNASATRRSAAFRIVRR